MTRRGSLYSKSAPNGNRGSSSYTPAPDFIDANEANAILKASSSRRGSAASVNSNISVGGRSIGAASLKSVRSEEFVGGPWAFAEEDNGDGHAGMISKKRKEKEKWRPKSISVKVLYT
jgi:hypothetical protein